MDLMDWGLILLCDRRCDNAAFIMRREALAYEELTFSVIGSYFEVYNNLGHGFLEHLYVMALERELMARGHQVSREVNVPVFYKGERLGWQRLDMIVDDKLVIEVRSTIELPKDSKRQRYNYLKATRLEVGLLLHFGPEPKFYRLDYRHAPPPPMDCRPATTGITDPRSKDKTDVE